jgi:hypothetical protein
MIYLVGTCHSVQCRWPGAGPTLAPRISRFQSYIAKCVEEQSVVAAAEESNGDVEARNGPSIVRLFAEGLRPPMQYIACEMPVDQRLVRGIPTDAAFVSDVELANHFPAREDFWIDCIREKAQASILLVCGANHVETVPARLANNGIARRVLCADWCASDDLANGEVPLDERPI